MDSSNDINEHITPESFRYMVSMSGWMRFVGIVCIVLLSLAGVIMVIGLAGSLLMGRGQGSLMSLVVLVMLGVFMWMFIKLLRAAKAFKEANRTRSSFELEPAMRNLKLYFMITAIFTILSVLLNVYMMVTGNVDGSMNQFNDLNDFF